MSDQRNSIPRHGIRELIWMALDILPRLYCPRQRLFCSYQKSDGERVGVSARYSLICAIGLHRATQAGYGHPFDLHALYEQAAHGHLTSAADTGLMLWVGSLIGRKENPEIYRDLTGRLNSRDILKMTGMELGLSLSGLVSYGRQGGAGEGLSSAKKLVEFILARCVHPRSHLFYHTGGRTLRRTFPNFASQVYLMHGLAQYAAEDSRAVQTAINCAESLCSLQRPDGGWPWLYRASGSVVEDYEIYSVHQDAMLPMAFLEVGKASSDPHRYREPVVRGLRWLNRANELQFDMIDRAAHIVHRSIRRRAPFHKVALGLNTLCSFFVNHPLFSSSGFPVEINRTDRPYHLGWILYAWCGREDLFEPEI